MAAFAGYGGNVIFASGYTTNVYSWSVDFTSEALESTDFTSAGYRTYIPGLKSWSGSFECRLDSANAIATPGAAPAAATFSADGTRTYTGDILITSNSLSVAVDGLASITVSFQGSGELTIN